jgi:phosphoribosylglycinamide formyltransferase-1
MKPYRLALFASGNGTNAEAIIRYFQNHPRVEVRLVLSNNPEALALQRARNLQVPSHVFTRAQFHDPAFAKQLHEAHITHIVLAGFMWLIPAQLVQAFPQRIINIHPALLPKFGGKGMYGMRVHQAVREAGETETGITIHEVNEHYDEGTVLFQARCAVAPTDTAEQIARKVHALEHDHFPPIIERWVSGQLAPSNH